MRLSSEALTLNSPAMDKSNGKMKKSNTGSFGGCRILKFLCMSPGGRSTEETNRDLLDAPIFSSSATSDFETAPATPNRGRELVISSQLRNFAFNELKLATRNFRPDYLLGVGGFGSVYKGWINENGSSPVKQGTGLLPVAVKTLNEHGLQGHREWLAEVKFLGNLHHQNLVTLVGYCMEGDKRLLVYEFMACGSLENHLFRRTVPLSWNIRMKIALGAAQGLAYLHEEAQKPVIYRDFKTSNILLDEFYNAKLSDFGLARDGPDGDETHVSTRVVGTYGYTAPEYVMTGHLTTKSDVYSFGVVLLEMITGRKSMDDSRPMGEQNLVAWAQAYLADRRTCCALIDPRLEGYFPKKAALRSSEIVARCLRENAKSRPQMSEVVEMLAPLALMRETSSARNIQNNGQSSNNVQAGVVAKDKHVAGSLPSPSALYMSSSNNTLTNVTYVRNIT